MWLQKKSLENAFLTLLVNYRKIIQKNKFCHLKQQFGYLMIYDVIYSFPVLIEKLVFINSFKGYYILILQLILGKWSFIFVASDVQMSMCVF